MHMFLELCPVILGPIGTIKIRQIFWSGWISGYSLNYFKIPYLPEEGMNFSEIFLLCYQNLVNVTAYS